MQLFIFALLIQIVMKLVVLNDVSLTNLGIISSSPEHHSCHYLPLPHWQFLHRIQGWNCYRTGTIFLPSEKIFPVQHWILQSLDGEGEYQFLETSQKKCGNFFFSSSHSKIKKYTNHILEELGEDFLCNWENAITHYWIITFFYLGYVGFYFPLQSLYLSRWVI